MQATDTTPRVWIACLASYNAGRLIGEWVDATDLENFGEAVERIKVAAVAAAKDAGEWPLYFGEPEEFAIHDYDGFPSSVVSMLGEYPDWALVAAIGRALEDDGDGFAAFLKFWGDCIGGDLDENAVDTWEKYVVGSGVESEEDYAMQYADDMGITVPDKWPFGYIDWERAAEELFRHGTLYRVNGYVFDSEAA